MTGRICSRCKQHKPADAFYVNGVHSDGSPRLRSRCKDCISEIVTTPGTEPKRCPQCRKTKPPEEFHGNASWCRPCNNKKTYEYRRGPGREAHNARMVLYTKERYAADPQFRLRHSARQAVIKAVKAGELKRPARCPSCKRKTKVQGHHHQGYDKPNWLNVVWLCARCHFQEDKTAHGVK